MPSDLYPHGVFTWQCQGCREYFNGSHREKCPKCGRVGYWCGSHDRDGSRLEELHGEDRDDWPPLERLAFNMEYTIAASPHGSAARSYAAHSLQIINGLRDVAALRSGSPAETRGEREHALADVVDADLLREYERRKLFYTEKLLERHMDRATSVGKEDVDAAEHWLDVLVETILRRRASRPSPQPQEEKVWVGAWNNWVAPFHACPRCGRSLNWKKSSDVLDRDYVGASCCNVSFGAYLTDPSAPLSTEPQGDGNG